MALNKVEICGVNTSKLPLLTSEEKDALFARILKGDKNAREEYIKGNLRLVLSVIPRTPMIPNWSFPAAMKMWTTCFKSDASA